jgi:hypothetical protein
MHLCLEPRAGDGLEAVRRDKMSSQLVHPGSFAGFDGIWLDALGSFGWSLNKKSLKTGIF